MQFTNWKKNNPDQMGLRFKARCKRLDHQIQGTLGSEGLFKVPGYGFTELFAPVKTYSTVRTIHTMDVKHRWRCKLIDASNAFPYAELSAEIYTNLQDGYTKENGEEFVYCLNKAIWIEIGI